MAKNKTAAAPKKAGGGSKFDFQQFLLDKGEKIGLIVAGVLFGLLALFGVLAASSASNPSRISEELRAGADRIDVQLRETPGEQPPAVDVPSGDVKFRVVKSSEFVTPKELFNTSGTINEKRTNPTAFTLIAGEAFFTQGGIPVYDIQDDKIATLKDKQVVQNNARNINFVKDQQKRARLRPGAQPAPSNPPPGGSPTTPAPGGPPIPGGPSGGGPAGGNFGGRGKAAMPQRRTDDAEIVYISLDSEGVDQAELALNLAPTRMAVIRGLVPYKKQVAKHMQSLRIESDAQLGPDAPSYRGFNVERQVLKADGKTVVQDWLPFDPVEASRELYRLAANLDPEDEKHLDFIPDAVHKLYLPRPRLTRGTYYAPGMPELAQAIEELKQSGPPKDLTDKQKKVKGQADLFGLRPIAGTVATPQPGMPLPPPPTGPVPGYPPPGAGRGGDGIRGGPPSGRGGFGGAVQPSRNSASPVWMLQFIDPTIEPGFAYRYRIQLKLDNPNYRKEALVAYPGLAQQEEILSDWFEVPGTVVAPPDEHLYAAGERAKDRSSIGTAEYDTTNLKFHRWYDYIRVTRDNARPDPIGEWVVADLDVKRGQHARQDNKSFKVPLWSMVKGNFIFRDRISVVGGGQRLTQIAKMENVKMSFDTAVPVLVVDFEGGKGSYKVSNGTVADDCAVETLMLTGIDGQEMKLTARNAAADKLIEDRRLREESWARWLEEVRAGGDATNTPPTGRGAP